MRAAVVVAADRTPVYAEFADPRPEDGFTIVDVAASALSNATRARATGSHYSSTGGFPLVPGIDGVGRTADGARVAFLLPKAPFGGMAERTFVPDALCMPVPDDLTDVMAAAILNPGQSPIGALKVRARLQPGESVLVNGATGTTGQVAVQIAQHLGAGRVVATGRNPTALTRLRQLGADATVDLTGDPEAVLAELVEHLASGIDVVLDYLGGGPTETVLAAVTATRASAPLRYVLAGGAAGASTTVPLSVLASAPMALMGSGIGAVSVPDIIRCTTEALQLARSANLRIDVTEWPLSQVGEAWTADRDHSRIVLTT